ncbi:MAG TPA: hypothetical protein VMT88_05430, partial [Actinomycetes bacterium]|nr:hypothetical protein [Actinomycetes bacterium]
AAAQWFALHYDHNDYLPHDPDDRDAFLCMGALVETIVLAGVRHQVSVDVVDVFERSGSDLHVLDVVLRATPESFSEVERRWAELASDRHTNRSKYTAEALPVELTDELTSLGCSFVSPDQLSDLVDEASKLSWNDRRFVADLERYCHSEVSAPRGMTANGLMLTRYEWAFLQGAFSLGKLPGWLGRVFSARDVRLMRTAPAVAVLGADSLNPKDLVEAGRRLLRCWSLVSGTGWAYHPISISVDRPETAPRVAALSGIPVPAAVFRIGRPSAPASRSNRVQLIDVFQE